IIRDLAPEFFLECHHQFDGVQAVRTEVVNEARVVRHLIGLSAQMLHDDLLHPLANVTHRSNLCALQLALPAARPAVNSERFGRGCRWQLAPRWRVNSLPPALPASQIPVLSGRAGVRLSYFQSLGQRSAYHRRDGPKSPINGTKSSPFRRSHAAFARLRR